MRICLITDEVSADPETAIELGAEWGIQDFELRGYFLDRVPRFTAFQRDRLAAALERHRARIVALSPGLFKCPAPTPMATPFPVAAIEAGMHAGWKTARDRVEMELNEVLPATLAYAHELGAERVVVFSFQRSLADAGHVPDEVVRVLHQAADMAKAAGLALSIEVEAGHWADTGAHTAQLLALVDHPGLSVNWDPGNALEAGDVPFPDGYRRLGRSPAHVHFKDARHLPGGGVEYTVEGEIDWSGQIRALKQDGFAGYIAVETHMRPQVASARQALARLRHLIAAV